jgi:hypothetical protein
LRVPPETVATPQMGGPSSWLATSFPDTNVRGSGPDRLCRDYRSALGACAEDKPGSHAKSFSVSTPRVSKVFVREEVIGFLEWTVDPVDSTGQAQLKSRKRKGGICHSARCGYHRRIRAVWCHNDPSGALVRRLPRRGPNVSQRHLSVGALTSIQEVARLLGRALLGGRKPFGRSCTRAVRGFLC